MRWYRKFSLWIQSLFRGESLDRELEGEIRFHVERQTAENIAAGMSPVAARRSAMIEFGGKEAHKEASREVRKVQFIQNFLQDLRFGFRMLWRNPGFSVLAILCLALGIGANAAVYSWIEGILFRPYPAVAHQERLFALTGTSRNTTETIGVSWPDFVDLRNNTSLVESFIAGKIMGTTLSIGDRAETATGQIVSANYFQALGVQPLLGRGFEPEEDFGRNTHPVTVISYQVWKERFHGDPDIIGKTQRLNGVVHTIVGVAPDGFYGTFVGYSMQFWVPASMEEIFETGGYKLEDRSARWVESFVRLKPGVSLEQAQSEMSAVAKHLEDVFPETNRSRGVKLWPLWLTPFNGATSLLPTLEIMFVVVVCVLLIASANVGNLLLVRSFARRHEITVRLAIGAGRGRLIRQLLTEGLILSAIASVVGVLIAHWSRHLLIAFFPANGTNVYLPGEVDWRVLAVSAAVCLFSTFLFALVPAIQASKVDLAAALKSEMGGVVGGHGKSWMRSSLVLVQVALSFVLLVGGSLLMKSLLKIQDANPGFSTQGVLTTGVDLLGAGYNTERAKSFQDQIIDRVQALPGIESAAFAQITPMFLGRGFSSDIIDVDGYAFPPGEQPVVEYDEVGPGYLATMGIPLVAGREFTRNDNESSQLVAVVNEFMAGLYWHGRDPIGQRLQVKGRWMKIVGVAKLSKYRRVNETPKAFFYVPLRQNFSPRTSLNIRTPLPPETIMPMLAREYRALDQNLAPRSVITMAEQVSRSTWTQRVSVILLGVLGGLALLLAAIGLYGVMSYAVSQSKREMGLRMALGASSSRLLWSVMSRGLALTAGGIALGAVAALVMTRMIANLLYSVSPRDPVSYASAFLVLMAAAALACFLPAWRASRTDPMGVLRQE